MKTTTSKAAAATENESINTANAQEQQPVNEAQERNTANAQEQQEAEELSQLQQTACETLNELWKRLREQGYKVYNSVGFISVAFKLKKDEEGNSYFMPRNISNSDKIGHREKDDEDSKAIAQANKEKPITRNVMSNHGKTRSINVGANNNGTFKK